MHHHKYSLEELENMLPWEREIYIQLLNRYLRDMEEQEQQVILQPEFIRQQWLFLMIMLQLERS